MKTAIIMVSYKSEFLIKKNIERLSKNHNIIIIDNSQNKLLKKNLEHKFKNVQVFLHKNDGFGEAANFGAKKAKAKYILFCSPDNFIEKNAIIKLEQFSKIKKDDFGLLVLSEKKELQTQVYEIKKPVGISTFFALKKNFLKIGGFDKKFFLYFEDTDLIRRIILKKFKIYKVPIVFNSFMGSHNPKYNHPIELNRNWHFMWSKFYYLKKYNGYFFSILITFPYLIRSAIKIVINLRNKKKRKVYMSRFNGLINSYALKRSWYRPNLDNK